MANTAVLPNSSLTLSPNGAGLIKDWEQGPCGGVALKAYLDDVGVPTIGWGHTHGVKLGQTITAAQAEAFFNSDVAWAVSDIGQLVKVPLTPNEFDALVTFDFNYGTTKFAKSDALKALSAHDFIGFWLGVDQVNKGTISGQDKMVEKLRTKILPSKRIKMLQAKPEGGRG